MSDQFNQYDENLEDGFSIIEPDQDIFDDIEQDNILAELEEKAAAEKARQEVKKSVPKKRKIAKNGEKAEILSKEDEYQLAMLARGIDVHDLVRIVSEKEMDRARQRIILAYRPLALSKAQDIAKKSGQNITDLVQEAMLALSECIYTFEPELGNRFATFASWHILGNLSSYVMNYRGPVRIGTNTKDKKVFMKFGQARAVIESREQRSLNEGDIPELTLLIGLDVETDQHIVKRMLPRMSNSDLSMDSLSFDSSEDNDASAADRLMGDGVVATADEVETGMIGILDHERIGDIINESISEITSNCENASENTRKRQERQQYILRERLKDSSTDCIERLAEEIGVSPERVRQIERDGRANMKRIMERNGHSFSSLVAFA